MKIGDTVSGASYLACADQLPSLPAVIFDVLKLCRKDSVEVRDLVRAINRDPALTARLLKLANSALYGGRGRLSTIEDAVVRLGTKSVMVAALSFSLTGSLPVDSRIGEYEVERFWRRAMIESIAARTFAQRLDTGNDAESFTCGLLMDIGIPLFAKVLGPAYVPVVRQMDAGHPEAMAEQDAVGADHAEVAAFLAREWRLPDAMAEAVGAHHDPDRIGDAKAGTRDLARVLHMAHLSAGVILSDGRAMRLRQLEDKAAAWFGKSGSFVDGVLGSIDRTVQEFAEAVRIDATGLSPAQMLEQARMELINVSMAAASALSQAESRVVELESKATTDCLTGLCNRAFFDAAMTSEWDRRKGGDEHSPLGLLMVDVDHFKRFNDTYGHATGDDVLRAVGRALRSAVRDSDLVCRYGGEEFAVICPGTPATQLRAVAERIRKTVAASRIETDRGPESVTVSVGCCVLASTPSAPTFKPLVLRSDGALYEAKRSGRNRVAVAPEL
jgi:diguanylate cyclase (GGDEF)-like protein